MGLASIPKGFLRTTWLALAVACAAAPASRDARAQNGEQLYRTACAACHGTDGKGASPALTAFDIPLPDFTDCGFATREADADWGAVTHAGGPARAFDRRMPAFTAALTADQIQSTLDYIRTLCTDRSWPRGELNLPRALVTEKAFPEDEVVFTSVIGLEGERALMYEFVYEKRLGARSQYEIVVPFGVREREGGGWTGGTGDLALGFKRALFHSLRSGSILSVTAEMILPTGDEDDDLGKGTAVFEPFISFGQLLPRDAFFQLQFGAELPFDTQRAQEEGFLRGVLGRSFTQGRWGRSWSPMIEVLAAREFAAGQTTHWDLLPQLQVSLSKRQHILASAGVRFPLNDTAERRAQLWAYLLWDFFDGGILEGW